MYAVHSGGSCWFLTMLQPARKKPKAKITTEVIAGPPYIPLPGPLVNSSSSLCQLIVLTTVHIWHTKDDVARGYTAIHAGTRRFTMNSHDHSGFSTCNEFCPIRTVIHI